MRAYCSMFYIVIEFIKKRLHKIRFQCDLEIILRVCLGKSPIIICCMRGPAHSIYDSLYLFVLYVLERNITATFFYQFRESDTIPHPHYGRKWKITRVYATFYIIVIF